MNDFCAMPKGPFEEQADYWRDGTLGRFKLASKKSPLSGRSKDLKAELNMTCEVVEVDTVARCMYNRMCDPLVLNGVPNLDVGGIGEGSMASAFDLHNEDGRYHRDDPAQCSKVCDFLHSKADEFKSFGVMQCHDEFDD